MQRRELLGIAASALMLSSVNRRAAAIDPFERLRPAHMKLSLAAYSLRKYLQPRDDETQKMDLFDFVDFCAEQGLPGAELTSYYFPNEITDEYLFELKRHCHLRGVSISGGAIRNDFCSLDEEKVRRDMEHTKMWVDHYAKLGAPVIRIFAGNANTEEPLSTTLTRCAKRCEEACRYAAGRGVMLALENHGGVTAEASGLLEIVKQVESNAFGVNFDSGNFRSSGDPYAELAQIAPYAINAQVKTEISPQGNKQEADLGRIVNVLRESGYSGWVALEYEASEEPLEAIPKYVEQLRTLLKRPS
jgi:sugar phosphate isomerase/epimerase